MSEAQQLPVSTIKDATPHLRRPFTAAAVKWKIQVNPSKEGGYALVVGFIDARLASERLNAVCPDMWSEEYAEVEGGLTCTITLRERGGFHDPVARTDVGWSKGRALGMDLKALYSDAFKRAAVKHGVGVSIYAMPQQFLKDDGTVLKKLRSGYKITEQGIAELSKRYEAWLKKDGKVFGDPLDHGDAVGSYGDVEAETSDVAPEKAAAPKAEKKPRKISKAGIDAIEGLLDKSGNRAACQNWAVASGVDGHALGELTADQGKELHAYLKEQT